MEPRGCGRLDAPCRVAASFVSCRVRRQRRTRGQAFGRPRGRPGDFSLQRDGRGRSAAPVGREVEGCGGRVVSGDRGSLTQVRAGENGRIRPGRVPGSIPQLAYGTSRSRLGGARVRVGCLRDRDDEEREGDGDSGERVRAPPDPSKITPIDHRLSLAASRTSPRPQCEANRHAEWKGVVASSLPREPNPGLAYACSSARHRWCHADRYRKRR